MQDYIVQDGVVYKKVDDVVEVDTIQFQITKIDELLAKVTEIQTQKSAERQKLVDMLTQVKDVQVTKALGVTEIINK